MLFEINSKIEKKGKKKRKQIIKKGRKKDIFIFISYVVLMTTN